MTESALASLIGALFETQTSLLVPRLHALGVSQASFQLLSAVYAAGDRATQTEVGRRLGVAPATLSEAVQTHVARDLLEQHVSPTDRRVRRLALTPRGRELMRRVLAEVAEVEQAMIAGIPASRQRDLFEGLSQMASNLDRERQRRVSPTAVVSMPQTPSHHDVASSSSERR